MTVWIGEGGGLEMIMPLSFLWGLCLIVAVGIMAYVSATNPSTSQEGEPVVTPTGDD